MAKLLRVISICFLLFIMAGCSGAAVTTQPATATVPESQPFTETLMPSKTLPATATGTSMPTLTQTNTPTLVRPTLLPTLQLTEHALALRKMVGEKLVDNGGCRLPCWWGITPGETTWEEAKNILRDYDPYIDWKKGYPISEQVVKYTVSLIAPIDVDWLTTINPEVTVTKGVVTGIDIYNYKEIMEYYYQSNILKAYGRPSEVALAAYSSEDIEGFAPFGMLVFYEKEHFMFEYVGFKSVDFSETSITICPLGQWSFLYIWDKNEDMTFQEAVQRYFSRSPEVTPLSINYVTTMNVDTFYETYQDENTDVCFKTMRDIWPPYYE